MGVFLAFCNVKIEVRLQNDRFSVKMQTRVVEASGSVGYRESCFLQYKSYRFTTRNGSFYVVVCQGAALAALQVVILRM